jgi:predicted component of type VI protein secretion system
MSFRKSGLRWAGWASAFALAGTAPGCLFGGGGETADPSKAIDLSADAPQMGLLDCDDGSGDCHDWYRVTVAEAAALELTVATVAGQSAGSPLAIAITDSQQLTLADTPSGGRPRFGLRWSVEPGVYFVWVRVDGSTKGELRYQISASLKHGAAADLGAVVDPTAPRLCLRVQASPKANFHGGQPHVVKLAIYPLQSALGFEQAHVDDLLGGAKPSGATGDPIVVRVVPGEQRSLEDPLPASTRMLGIVADYYRPTGIQGGRRKATVSASCGQGESTLLLDEKELRLP